MADAHAHSPQKKKYIYKRMAFVDGKRHFPSLSLSLSLQGSIIILIHLITGGLAGMHAHVPPSSSSPLALRNVYYLVFRRGCELDSELLLFTNRLWRGLFRAARATGETKSRSGWKWRRIADIYIYIFIFIRI